MTLIPAVKPSPLPLLPGIVLRRDLPEEGLRAGDGGVIVEHDPARIDVSEGYDLESLAATGQTIAIVPVPASAVREAAEHEGWNVRDLARA